MVHPILNEHCTDDRLSTNRRTSFELYLIRHCQASGQASNAPLTSAGFEQAEKLADFLQPLGIRTILSSPFLRARQSIEPLARRIGGAIEIDDRLAERVLSDGPLVDWKEDLRASFDDMDRCLSGGETSRDAMRRGVAAIMDAIAIANTESPLAVVSHGNLLALILRHFDGGFGYQDWLQMTNPDVFRVSIGPHAPRVERICGQAVHSIDELT